VVQFGEQRHGKTALGERATEPAQRGLIRRAVIQAEAAEATERQPVRQRFLETRIGELVPLRQQQRASRQATPAVR
jgi:hypothetical protein